MRRATICSIELSSAKPNGLEFPRLQMKQGKQRRSVLLVRYLENSGHIIDGKVWRQALKYVMLDNTLYHRTIDGLLLKCLGSNQSKIVMGEVHEGIYGTHQSAHRMKWLLCHARFYWPTMLNDCYRYYKGCRSCRSSEMCS
jgi:hypothetical protein